MSYSPNITRRREIGHEAGIRVVRIWQGTGENQCLIIARSLLKDESLEEAAMDLGGRPFRVALDITFPLIAPAMVAGWLLAFTLSLDDLVIASFVSGPGGSTLPMLIFSKVKLGVSPDINALATLIIVFISLSLFIAYFVNRRSQSQQA